MQTEYRWGNLLENLCLEDRQEMEGCHCDRL